MTPQASLAPVTTTAREIDLTNNPTATEVWTVCFDHFSDELVAGRARESIVPAKKLQIRVADASTQQTDHRIALRPARFWNLLYGCTALLKVNRNHSRLAYHLRFSNVMERIR